MAGLIHIGRQLSLCVVPEVAQDDQEKAPLLGCVQAENGKAGILGVRDDRRPSQSQGPAADMEFTCEKRLFKRKLLQQFLSLMWLAKAHGGLVLVLLSLLEVVVVARVGVIAGTFYKALVNGEAESFWDALWGALFWYGSAAACRSLEQGTAEYLALCWRRRLTLAAHRGYVNGPILYRLARQKTVDNPDQRVAKEIELLCTSVTKLMLKTVALPLMILYYSYLVACYVGILGPPAIYLFFMVGCIGSCFFIAPIASLVVKQEKLEGDFRTAHVRLRENAERVALCQAAALEKSALDLDLHAVLHNQKALVLKRTLLKFATDSFDYAGCVLNYLVLGVPIFAGTLGQASDKGAVAQYVSNASFAVLTLIYSFSQLIDASRQVSDIAGYTARVAEFFEALDGPCPPPKGTKHDSKYWTNYGTVSTPSPPPKQPSRTPEPPQSSHLLYGPTLHQFGRNSIQLSVHHTPDKLCKAVEASFVGISTREVLIIPTFQLSSVDLCQHTEALVSQEISDEMDRLLDVFLSFLQALSSSLSSRGYWVDAVDPRTGYALGTGTSEGSEIESHRGSRYSEVHAATILLGYEVQESGACPIIKHPQYGTKAYPASVFTNAPLAELVEVLRVLKVCLSIRNLTCTIPGGSTLVRDLTLDLRQGDRLLLIGPSGCGKTSLLRCLAGLWPVTAGTLSLFTQRPPLVLPQTPLLARGGLAAQITYPLAPAFGWGRKLKEVLEMVELGYLLERVKGDWMAEMEWSKVLSTGEAQRLSLARVFFHRPELAFLDEATSAVSEDVEARIYTRLASLPTGFVSVSHHRALERWHAAVLTLKGDQLQSWELRPSRFSQVSNK